MSPAEARVGDLRWYRQRPAEVIAADGQGGLTLRVFPADLPGYEVRTCGADPGLDARTMADEERHRATLYAALGW